jgi:hypothetical protein
MPMSRRRLLQMFMILPVLPALAKSSSSLGSSIGVFAFGGVGFAGQISPGEKFYRTIMSLPPVLALSRLEELFQSENAQAKCYALVGIRKLDPQRFEQLYLKVKDSKVEVKTMEGCIIDHSSLGEVAKRIAKGSYDQSRTAYDSPPFLSNAPSTK